MTTTVPSASIADFLASVALAPRQAHKSLTVWPLVRREGGAGAAAAAYVPLARALEVGWLDVDEVSEGGAVPLARVTNRGGETVLVLFGEELIGAKQNRIANASFLVPAASELVIDVSRVEAGRWGRARRDRFTASEAILSSKLRRTMLGRVLAARAAGGRFEADQGEVWDEVAERVAFANVEAPTSAYADYRASRATELDEIGRAFHPVPGQLGFVAAAGDEVLGVEAIGSPEVFVEAFRRLLSGYAIDAVDAAFHREREARRHEARASGGEAAAPRFDAPEPFLEALAAASTLATPSLGLGTDLRLEGDTLSGCALVCADALVHLTAYPAEGA